MEILPFISVLLIVACFQQAEGLVECMSCKGVPEPHDCKETIICAEHEECSTDFYITPQGNVFYDLGCSSKRVCDALTRYAQGKKRNTGYVKTKHTGSGQDVGPVKRQNGNLYICQECCNTEHCNMYGCNDPKKLNRTVCYSCPDVVHPSKCDNLDVCDIDKQCYTRHFINDMFEDRYKLGCEEKKICDIMVKNGVVAGHPKRQEFGGFDAIDLCYYCCNTNFCNRKDCIKGLLTSSLKPSTSIASTTMMPTTNRITTPTTQYKTSPKTQPSTTATPTTQHNTTPTTQPSTTATSTTQHKTTPTTQPSTTATPTTQHKTTPTTQPSTTATSTTQHKTTPTTQRSTTATSTTQHKTTPKLTTQPSTTATLTTQHKTTPTTQRSTTATSTTQHKTTPKLTTQPSTTATLTTQHKTTPTTQPSTTAIQTTKHMTTIPVHTTQSPSPTTTQTPTKKHTTKAPTHQHTTPVHHHQHTTKVHTHKTHTPVPSTKIVTHTPSTAPPTHAPTTDVPSTVVTTHAPTTNALPFSCYHCEYINHEKECNYTEVCNKGEDRCFLSRVDGGDDNDNLCFYKMGCMSESDCHTYTKGIHHNGKIIMAGSQDQIEHIECCSSRNCNEHKIRQHPHYCLPMTTLKP